MITTMWEKNPCTLPNLSLLCSYRAAQRLMWCIQELINYGVCQQKMVLNWNTCGTGRAEWTQRQLHVFIALVRVSRLRVSANLQELNVTKTERSVEVLSCETQSIAKNKFSLGGVLSHSRRRWASCVYSQRPNFMGSAKKGVWVGATYLAWLWLALNSKRKSVKKRVVKFFCQPLIPTRGVCVWGGGHFASSPRYTPQIPQERL